MTAGDFGPAKPWSSPIDDYLAVGEANFPDGFTRSITALAVSDPDGAGPRESLLWIGYGDATRNLGTKTPIEFRYFVSPDDPGHRVARVLAGPPVLDAAQGQPQRTPSDTGEEQLEPYRVIGGALWQAGVDSNDPDELWTQAKPAPHKRSRATSSGSRSVGGSRRGGSSARFPAANTCTTSASSTGRSGRSARGPRIAANGSRARSSDTSGRARMAARPSRRRCRAMFPEKGKGDTRFRRLLPAGDSLYVFGYVNPFVDGGPIEGRHVVLRDGVFTDLVAARDGAIADLLVLRTWPLDAETGLALARNPDRSTRIFLVEPGSIREFDAWKDLAVIDVAPGEAADEFVLVAGDRAETPSHGVFAFSLDDAKAMRAPTKLLDLPGVTPSAIAMWRGEIFVGTEDGRVMRAERANR